MSEISAGRGWSYVKNPV